MSYSKILNNLYLGNQYATEVIKNIDMIISIGCNSKYKLKTIEHIQISLRDKDTSDITPFLDFICDTININLLNNK